MQPNEIFLMTEVIMIGIMIIILFIFVLFYKIQKLTIHNGLCEFSKKYFDIHDYPKDKGGDGVPTHMYTYTCPNCGKEFGI